jgi:chromosome segregation ATPase
LISFSFLFDETEVVFFSFQKVDFLEKERETLSETLKSHFEKKLKRMSSLEKELETKIVEISDFEEKYQSLQKREQELMQQVKKQELAIQKIRFVEPTLFAQYS